MPIANCIVTSECQKKMENSAGLIETWAKESGISPEHMTINIVVSNAQVGNRYDVMANLNLPSLWSKSDVSSIQLGLARALAQHYKVTSDSIHVITNIVDSGMVVESCEEIKW